jgi:cytidylate kinase
VHEEADASAQRPSGLTVVVALDGPSGTGKSTVSRGVARALGLRYLDTGAMYRAVTLAVLRAEPELAAALIAGTAPIGDPAQHVTGIARDAQLTLGTEPDEAWVRLGGGDVTAAIRTPEVTQAVSAVSAVPDVRRLLVDQQRGIIGSGGIVVEGRDIASVVWPAAELKVFLTASAEARAARRAREMGAADVRAVQSELTRRDGFDSSRADSPLGVGEGAVVVDTSNLSVDEVIQALVDMTRKASIDA